MIYYINRINDRTYHSFSRRHTPILDMYSLILVEITNDMSFPLLETKYDEPF